MVSRIVRSGGKLPPGQDVVVTRFDRLPRRRMGALVVACVVATLTVACGSGQDATTGEPSITTTIAPTTAAAAAHLRDATISVRRDPG